MSAERQIFTQSSDAGQGQVASAMPKLPDKASIEDRETAVEEWLRRNAQVLASL